MQKREKFVRKKENSGREKEFYGKSENCVEKRKKFVSKKENRGREKEFYGKS